MVELIQQLLQTNNCVIIPNFGAFIGNYNPAEVRLQENTILPPNKIIAFNRSLQKNDGVLKNAVALEYSITYKEAEESVIDFSRQCNDSLTNNKSLIFKDIGKLILDNDSNIQFQPYFTKNYLLESYGLPSLSLQPIQRLKDTESTIKETYLRILHPELMQDLVSPKRTTSKLSYWITAFLAITFLVSSLTWNIHKSNDFQNQTSLVPVFKNKAINTKSKPVEVSIPLNSDIVTKPVIEEVKSAPIATTTLPAITLLKDKSYIAIGIFFNESRAMKLKTEVEGKGYTVKISKDEINGLFRTTIVVSNLDISTSLQKVKSEINHGAWVYCVNCSL